MNIVDVLDQDRIDFIKPIMGSDYDAMSEMVSKVDTLKEATEIIRDWTSMLGIATITFAP